ncbi:MAG: hypothetical protein KAJ46_04245 [Sedimentisphaerales bacterium]|nr:hypothetical protein [Sedimentisphaerales bacterium]
MIQCKDCEYFHRDKDTGRITLRCDPFSTIKEPACIDKMQLLRLDALLQSYQTMLRWYQKLAPMQEKMFDMVKREMDDYDESESWKYDELDEENDGDDGDDKDDEQSLKP